MTAPREADLLDLETALNRLGGISPRLADLVVMRFLGGLTIEETAGVLDSSPATVKRDWLRARAWLFRELKHMPSSVAGAVPAAVHKRAAGNRE